MSCLSLGWSAQPTILGQALYRLRDSCPSSTDITLFPENGNPIRAHRVVLAAFSQYFEHALNGVGRSSGELMVLVPNVQHSHLQLLLKYMYEGSVDVPEEDFSELNRIAQMLKVHMLGLNNSPADRPNTPMDSDELMLVDCAQISIPPRSNPLPEQSCLEQDISQNRMRGRESASKYQLSQKRMKVQKQQAEYQKKTEDHRFQKYQRQHVQSTHVLPLQTNLPSQHMSPEQQALQEQQMQTWENQQVVAQEQQLAQGQEHLPAQTQKENGMQTVDHVQSIRESEQRHSYALENQQMNPPNEVVILEQQKQSQVPGQLVQPQQTCGQLQKKVPRPKQIQPPVQQQQIQLPVQQQQIQPPVQQQQIQLPVQQQQPAQLFMQHHAEQRQQESTQTQKVVQLQDREQQTESHCELIKLEDDEDGDNVPPAQNTTPRHPSSVTQSPSTFLSSPSCSTSASCSTTPSSNTNHLANLSTNQARVMGISHKNVLDRISTDERQQSRGLSPITSSIQSSNNRLTNTPSRLSSQTHSPLHGNEQMETPSLVSSSHIPPSSQVPSSSQTQVIPNSSRASTSSETSNHSFEQSSFRQSPSQILVSSSSQKSVFASSPSNDHRLPVMGSTSSVVPSSVSHIPKQSLSSDMSSKTFVVPLPPPAPTPPCREKILSNVSRPGTPIPQYRSSSTSRVAGQGNIRDLPTPLPSWCQEVQDICSEEESIEDSGDSDVEALLMNEKEKVAEAADKSRSYPMSTWNNYEKSVVDNGLVVAYQASRVSHMTNCLPPSIATEAHPAMTSSVVSSGSSSNLSNPAGEQQEVNDSPTDPPHGSLGHLLRNYWRRGVRNGDKLDLSLNDVGVDLQDALPDEQEESLSQQERSSRSQSRGRGRGRRGRGRGRGRGAKRGHSSVSGREGSVRVKLRHLERLCQDQRSCSSREPNNQLPRTHRRSVFFKGVERTRKTLGRSSVRGRAESVQPVEKSSPRNRQTSSIARRVNAVSAKDHHETAPSIDAMSTTQRENEPAPEAEAEANGTDAETNLTHGDEASSLNVSNKTSRRNPHVCNFCGDGFPYKASLALHKKHNHQLITCRLCDSGFTTHRAFTQHKRWHQNLANNSLPTNNSNTLDDGVQDTNRKEDRNDTSHPTSSRTYRTNVFSGKLFSCSSCPATFSRRVLLLQHSCPSSS